MRLAMTIVMTFIKTVVIFYLPKIYNFITPQKNYQPHVIKKTRSRKKKNFFNIKKWSKPCRVVFVLVKKKVFVLVPLILKKPEASASKK